MPCLVMLIKVSQNVTYITVQDKMADIDSIWVLEGNLSYSLIKQLCFLNFFAII